MNEFSCGELIPRRSSGQKEMTLSTRGVRSERRQKVENRGMVAEDLNLLELISHFWGDYRRHSIRSYVVNVKYGQDGNEE